MNRTALDLLLPRFHDALRLAAEEADLRHKLEDAYQDALDTAEIERRFASDLEAP